MIPPFEILGKTFAIYPILAMVGIFAAGGFACRQTSRRGQDDNDMLILLLLSAIGVLAGSHLLYALTHPLFTWEALGALFTEGFTRDVLSWLAATFGGSVFYGGLLGGLAVGWIYVKKRRLPSVFCDIAGATIPLFHFFGRVGCFLGGCCYGVPCPVGFVYTQNPIPMANGVRRFPVQLLEAAFCLGLFFWLYSLLRKGRTGLLPRYLFCYSVGRFFLEFLRGDDYRGFLWGLSTSQWISVLLAAAVAVYWIARRVRPRPAGDGMEPAPTDAPS